MILFGTWERLQSVGFEHLYLLLRLRKFGLAILRQLQAALVRGQGLLQRELPGLHAGDEFFKFGQRTLEAKRRVAALGGFWRF